MEGEQNGAFTERIAVHYRKDWDWEEEQIVDQSREIQKAVETWGPGVLGLYLEGDSQLFTYLFIL